MKYRTFVWAAIALIGLVIAGWLLYRILGRTSPAEIAASVRSIPPGRLVLAFVCALGSYACLTCFDALGVRYAGRPLAYWKTALASFVSLSIGHNIGVAALSSGVLRYRFYARWGLSAGQVAKVILFSGMTVGLGLNTLGGIAMLLNPSAAAQLTGLGRSAIVGAAILCLSASAGYVMLAAVLRSALEIRGWRLDLPGPGIALAQVVVGSVNFAFVAGCLYHVLAAFAEAGYVEVSSAYVIANATALVSHVPGGLGVLEAVVIYLMGTAALIGPLIAFRFVYFFVPLGLGVLLLLASERWLPESAQEQRTGGSYRSSAAKEGG